MEKVFVYILLLSKTKKHVTKQYVWWCDLIFVKKKKVCVCVKKKVWKETDPTVNRVATGGAGLGGGGWRGRWRWGGESCQRAHCALPQGSNTAQDEASAEPGAVACGRRASPRAVQESGRPCQASVATARRM